MLLDISFGILLSIFANHYFHLPLNYGLVFLCVFLTLLPDIDSLLFLAVSRKKLNYQHREIMHYPPVFMLVGMLVYFFISNNWGILFLLAAGWHFLNDLSGIGWGIKLFWPFSKKYYKMPILPIHKAPGKPRLPYRFLYVWTRKELEEVDKKYGDINWLKNIYFKLSLILIIESVVFLMVIIVFFSYK